jgi:hypothetical protein
MTTIITKYGYGEPASGKLAKAEIAVDLSEGILYSSTDGSDIIELGRGEISWENISGKPPVIDPDNGGDQYVDLAALEAQVEANKGDIVTLKQNIIQINSDLADIIKDVETNAGAISDNATAIGENASAIKVNADNIKALTDLINAEPDGLVHKIEANAEAIAANKKEIEDLKAALDQDLTGLALGGTYSVEATASNNTIIDVTGSGAAHGFKVGDRLNAHMSDDDKGWYFIVQGNGELQNLSREGSNGATAQNGDWLVSDGTHGWILMSFGGDHVTWGAIGGNIENQDDLMEEFDKYLEKGETIDCGSYN